MSTTPPQREETFQLGEAIAELAAHLDAATHEYLSRLRRFDEASGWFHANAKSCAHWLSWRCGLEPVTAREHVRVAQALAAVPVIDASFSRGEISYSKVRAMARVMNPENQEQLLLIARQTTGARKGVPLRPAPPRGAIRSGRCAGSPGRVARQVDRRDYERAQVGRRADRLRGLHRLRAARLSARRGVNGS